MTLEECYTCVGGCYSEVLGRLRNPRLITRFLLRFPEEESYGQLCRSLEQGNPEETLRAVHTLKGVCQNLGLDDLAVSAEELNGILRCGIFPPPEHMVRRVREDYRKTVEAIARYREAAD